MKKIIKPVLLTLVVVIAAWLSIHLWMKYSARKNGGMTLYGNVDIRQVNLGFRVNGRIEKMLFEEGDKVKPGDVIAVLDKKPYQDSFNLYKAQVDESAAQLARLQAGFRDEEIAKEKANVAERKASFELQEKNMERAKALFEKNVISKQSYDETWSRWNETKAALSAATEYLNLVSKGYREEEITAAKATLNAAEARLEQTRTSLDDTEIKSPSEGIILTRVMEPGAIVAAGQTVYTISLTSPVWIRAYVNEPDLGRIHYGMPAKIFTDSAPDKPYDGHIGFISPEAEFTPKSVETPELRSSLVYRLRIIADNPDRNLLQGMPITVKLEKKKQ
ncbi:MAG TPA: secretion protein HlyD [Lentisphaeria bacterium]|nr:MAG: secretion protein HlyD [Lentisphaerae bacterium GWF2_49_21]HBC85890.1 secretion protein HlyD [Lentisphaeria bacterium]